MKHYAIIVAGGIGQRLGAAVPKQFLHLGNKPIIAWSIEAFITSKLIDKLIIAIHPDYISYLKELLHACFPNENILITIGGQTRQESCYNALQTINGSEDDIVLIHDAARPFITHDMIQQCIITTQQFGASGIYVPVKDTIAQVHDSIITDVLPRNTLFAAQTPQCFRYSVILEAHKKARNNNIFNASDDISLVVMAGFTVKAIIGDFYKNIKITTNEDMELAKLLIANLH